ncbi:MAG: hypothetical protein F6K23_24325 [Okeania sp. SIO2C9]|uniref:hypothetical protein n=1 Tax=Okeania sp. SIO2C9 TaxID=2607791 RepID=UPI0013C0498F|nr:hypothetical protein [Okeania sp. SIO2C9]NEQ75883.1 hypothetical protein [Okeania sp. SIO2C9]
MRNISKSRPLTFPLGKISKKEGRRKEEEGMLTEHLSKGEVEFNTNLYSLFPKFVKLCTSSTPKLL